MRKARTRSVDIIPSASVVALVCCSHVKSPVKDFSVEHHDGSQHPPLFPKFFSRPPTFYQSFATLMLLLKRTESSSITSICRIQPDVNNLGTEARPTSVSAVSTTNSELQKPQKCRNDATCYNLNRKLIVQQVVCASATINVCTPRDLIDNTRSRRRGYVRSDLTDSGVVVADRYPVTIVGCQPNTPVPDADVL
jgi:hypothetical protein